MEAIHECPKCHRRFTVKSNMTRHLQTHHLQTNDPKRIQCAHCDKTFAQKVHLESHAKQHLYPVLRFFKRGEAILKCSKEASKFVAQSSKSTVVDVVWLDPKTAEEAANRSGQELWHSNIVITFGKYAGKTFKWLLENDVGWVVWLLAAFCQHGEKNPSMLWQKKQLLEFVRGFPSIMLHLDANLKKAKEEKESPAESSVDPEFIEDAQLLALANDVLNDSEVAVTTKITSLEQLIPSTSSSSLDEGGPSTSTDDSTAEVLEGWQKFWEEPPPNTLPMYEPNIQWLKNDPVFGLYTKEGSRKVLKPTMTFNPPPLFVQVEGTLPSMLSFFRTPTFFWRPVGVMQLKVPCPNTDCPAPSGYSLVRHGYGSVARTVFGMKFPYTLLTERLICHHCMEKRRSASDKAKLQYSWNSSSSSVLQQLAPAVRSMFPAVIVGKRAVDKEVVTLLTDRINSVSMSKVYRVLETGHSEWYAERRDWYQTLLYKAHSAESSGTSQRGILPFIKPPGTYTPPLPQMQLPSPRTLRRAHLIVEMERMHVYRQSILSVTGQVLCIDGTKQILKKVYGDGQGTMHFLTSILNEWGQFVTAVVVASESEECYQRMARGLSSRFRRANAPAPKVLYTDNNCCRDGGTSWMESLFGDWVQDGMLIRLDIRHWLHRWDTVVIKQSHSKYGAFMSAMAGAILAFSDRDMAKLTSAIRKGNEDLYAGYSDQQMIEFVKPHQLKSYVRRVTRGVEESACAVEAILEEFKGDAGLDIDNIHLFKSLEAVDLYWAIACKHLGCMQDPPDIPLYVATKTVKLNGVELNHYRCCRGSNSLEGLHSHIVNAVPSKRIGIMPFQVSLVAFMVQWNKRMESRKIADPSHHSTPLNDPRLIQRLNHQSKVLFGKNHLFDPNFVAPMPLPAAYEDPEEEELIGVEYSYSQSTDFTSKEYYIRNVEEEQAKEEETDDDDDEEDDKEDEGIVGDSKDPEDPIDDISVTHAVLAKPEEVAKDVNPLMGDVLAPRRHLHLPGYEEVEQLALLLIKLADDSDEHLIPGNLRLQIYNAVLALADHDKSAKSFVKKYESRWGLTLFGRVLGPESSQSSAAQKTKFGWMRYAQAGKISEESRLLYVLIKMLKNRPAVSILSSPNKMASIVKGRYKRIVDRVRDDDVLGNMQVPLPNINAKSITNFLIKEGQRANYLSTVVPKAPSHRRVMTSKPIPDAHSLPKSLIPPNREQVQYRTVALETRDVRGPKRKLDLGTPHTTSGLPTLLPRPPLPKAPMLMVVPSQPSAASVSFLPSRFAPFTATSPPPPPPPPKHVMPNKSKKPCAACGKPNCDGQRRRYVPSRDKVKNSAQKMFIFCSLTQKSVSPGFTDRVYDSFDHFKNIVDAELAKNSTS